MTTNPFNAFYADGTALAILKHSNMSKAGVELVRQYAVGLLADAVRRVPRETPRVLAMYAENGIAPVWNLADDDAAVTFTLALREFDPTPDELHAAALLRACVEFNDVGEITPLVNEQLGAKRRAKQTEAAKAPRKATEAMKKEIIRRYAERLSSGEKYGAIKELSATFNLSEPTISAIVKPKNLRK